MQRDIERVLIDRHAIARRIEEVARAITADLESLRRPGRPGSDDEEIEVTLVPILTGSIIFVADLMRHLPVRMKIRVVSVSSYPGTATTSKGARFQETLNCLPQSLAGAHVLVIDDILDSSNTLRLVTSVLRERNPASLRVCVFLRKERPEARAFHVDYACFDIPDQFVVGYGLDYNDYYRNLPDVVTLRPEVIGR